MNTIKETKFDKFEYFANLNPLATKIAIEIKEVKFANASVWNKLNTEEQSEVVNGLFINPTICFSYENKLKFAISTNSPLSNSSVTKNSAISLAQDEFPYNNIKSFLLTNKQHEINFSAINSASSNSTLRGTITSNDLTSNIGNIALVRHNIVESQKFKYIYQFDGKNLSTYCKQKTGLKIVNDDVFGIFPDEHSNPFSVKSKSQINLVVFENKLSYIIEDSIVPSTLTFLKFNKVKEEVAERSKEVFDEINSIHKLQHDLCLANKKQYECFINNIHYTSPPIKRDNSIDIASENNNNLTWKIYSKDNCNTIKDNFSSLICDDENLSCPTNYNIDFIIAKNTSEVVSDLSEDLYNTNGYTSTTFYNSLQKESLSSCDNDDDEKCEMKEDSQLLDNDILRKGFEFLNNW